jgi:hypothetical protein
MGMTRKNKRKQRKEVVREEGREKRGDRYHRGEYSQPECRLSGERERPFRT